MRMLRRRNLNASIDPKIWIKLNQLGEKSGLSASRCLEIILVNYFNSGVDIFELAKRLSTGGSLELKKADVQEEKQSK